MNPKTFDSEAGFADGAPNGIVGMQLLQDVFVEYQTTTARAGQAQS